MWDTLELFDAFSIDWVDRSKNLMIDFLANIALRRDGITLTSVLEIEFKTRPYILEKCIQLASVQ